MRTIDRASSFKRDYKREAKGQHRATLDSDLKPVLVALVTDQPLDARYRDHDLSGDWAGYRECHVKPDLLLIYRKSDADALRLARLGSHSGFSVELVRFAAPVGAGFSAKRTPARPTRNRGAGAAPTCRRPATGPMS